MGSKSIEVYCYYKEQYPGTMIFFRVENNYEAYQEDATIAGPIVGAEIEKDDSLIKIAFPIEKVYDFVSLLSNHNIKTKLISRRDENGDFSLPDIDKIKNDQEIDY